MLHMSYLRAANSRKDLMTYKHIFFYERLHLSHTYGLGRCMYVFVN